MRYNTVRRFDLNKRERQIIDDGGYLFEIQSFMNAFAEFAIADVPMNIDFVSESPQKMYFIVTKADNPFDLRLIDLTDEGWNSLFLITMKRFENQIFSHSKNKVEVQKER